VRALRVGFLGMAAVGFAFLAVAAFAPTAAADLDIVGDWNITSVTSLTDQVINVTNSSETDGFVNILPGGELHLENCTLLLPLNRTLTVEGALFAGNSTIDGPSWFLWIRSRTELRTVELRNATFDAGGGFSGTFIISSNLVLQSVRWTQTNGVGASIHMRVPINFTDNFLGPGIGLSIEVPLLSNPVAREIARNRFALDGDTSTDAVSFAPQTHTAAVRFDIHHNNFTGGDDAVRIREASTTTHFDVHDNVFAGLGGSAVNANDADIRGSYSFWNLSVTGCGWAFYLRAAMGDGVTATLENVTITSCSIGVIAHWTDITVRNSTIDQTNPAYNGYFGGHIFIYDTTDTALSTLIDGTGGSVEHFAMLNIGAIAWQGGIPFQTDNLSLFTPTGVLGISINPSNWTPSFVVWWGSYDGLPNVDNRDLRPRVVIDGRSFGCAPVQFLVTRPMTPLDITCIDDEAPRITVQPPQGTRYQNSSTIVASGTATDAGTGVASMEWSFDNASWGPVIPVAGVPGNFTISYPSAPDGAYMLYFRARDRTGLTTYAVRGPIVVDTVRPPVTFDGIAPRANGLVYNVSGSTDPDLAVGLLTAGGLRFATIADGAGRFAFAMPLVEGLNTFWVTSTDRAGNTLTIQGSLLVDNVPPALAVFLASDASTQADAMTISGVTEAGANVEVNGAPATVLGEGFSALVALRPGRNLIAVNATDAAGNRAQWLGTVWSDSDLPLVTAELAAGNLTAGGIALTRSARASVTGVATDLTTAIQHVLVNGVATSVDAAGVFTLAVDLDEGENLIAVVAVDTVGNTASVQLRVVRDSTPPTATASLAAGDGSLVDLDGAAYTNGTIVKVVVVLSEDAVVEIGGVAFAGIQGINTFTAALAEGPNALVVAVHDAAGNAALPHTVSVTRDRTAPSISFTSPAEGSSVADSFALVVGVTEPGVSLTLNGVTVAVGAGGGFTARIDLRAGPNRVEAVVTDAVGNSNSARLSLTRADVAGSTGGGGAGSVAPWLGLGLGAGLAAGFLVARGRKRPPADEPAGFPEPAGLPASPPGRPPVKGPRGPRPPGPQR